MSQNNKFGACQWLLTMICASFMSTICSAFSQHGVHPMWGEDVQITNSSGFSFGVVGRNICVDSRNRIHVVWTYQSGSTFDVYYSRSVDGGATWSPPRDIVNSPFPATSPNIAVGPTDTLHLTWLDRRLGGNARVFYSRSFDAGTNWEVGRDISGPAPLSAGPALISVDHRNRVHVAWHIGDPDTQQGIAQVYYCRSVNGGISFQPPIRLNTNPNFHAAFPRFNVAGTRGDVIAIAWRDNRRAPDWDIYVAVSTDGGQTFTERIGRATPMRDWDPEALVDSSGVIHLSYMTYRPQTITIDYIRSTDFGQSWSPEITLSEARSRFPFWVPDMQNNTLWLFWKDERDASSPPDWRSDVAGKFSLDGGRTWSRLEFATDLHEVELKFPGITAGPDGKVYLVWSDRRYANDSEQLFFKSRAMLGDINADGCIDDVDLLAVLFAFGRRGSQVPEDINSDAWVDDRDLLMVLFRFGRGCW